MKVHLYTKKPNIIIFGLKFAATLKHSEGILCKLSKLKYIFSFDKITDNIEKVTCPECKELMSKQKVNGGGN